MLGAVTSAPLFLHPKHRERREKAEREGGGRGGITHQRRTRRALVGECVELYVAVCGGRETAALTRQRQRATVTPHH